MIIQFFSSPINPEANQFMLAGVKEDGSYVFFEKVTGTQEELALEVQNRNKDLYKENLMQMISDAIDNGADITVHVPQFKKTQKWEPVTKEEVEHKAVEISRLLNKEVKQLNCEHAHSFVVDNTQYRFVYSYIPFMEEDVQLDGMEEVI